MEIVKVETDVNQNDDIETDVKKLIVKVNNLIQHPDEPEYLVDLLSDQVMGKYGREKAEQAARAVLKSGSPELSEKFKGLLVQLDKQYFDGWLLSSMKVEVPYRIASRWPHDMWQGDPVFRVPASSEAVMVERLIEEMIERTVGKDCWECYRQESNRAHCTGAPMSVKPEMRHLSAEEFIAAATREPTTKEKEWLKHQTKNPPEPHRNVQSAPEVVHSDPSQVQKVITSPSGVVLGRIVSRPANP